MKKRKPRPRSEKPRMCDPGMCDCCQYIGEGDFICDKGPGQPVLVVEDWQPNENAGAAGGAQSDEQKRAAKPATPRCAGAQRPHTQHQALRSGKSIMTPEMQMAMMHEINQQCLEKDDLLALDVDCMVLWTLHRHLGFGVKRLHDFYLAMAAEHRRMRDFYEMDDLYPERLKLKELGADVEQWQKEVLANEPKTLGKR